MLGELSQLFGEFAQLFGEFAQLGRFCAVADEVTANERKHIVMRRIFVSSVFLVVQILIGPLARSASLPVLLDELL